MHSRRGSCCLFPMLLLAMAPQIAMADGLVSSPTNLWKPVTTASGNPIDYTNDQQTSGGSGGPVDIVGNATYPGFYMVYAPGATSTSGTLGFRTRLGTPDTTGYSHVLLVGIDGNNDGALDLFVGVDNQGSNKVVRFWNPGNKANTGPSTTSISAIAGQDIAEAATNYSYGLANPTGDVDLDGSNDYFLSFAVPFQTVVTLLGNRGITVTSGTRMTFMVATATQQNSLNQDIGGVPKLYDNKATWRDLGVTSVQISPMDVATPEPATWASFATICGVLACIGVRRRRRSN